MRYLILCVLTGLAAFASAADTPVTHKLGWQPDRGGVRDKAFINHPRFSGSPIKEKTDLRAAMPPVYDQGALGSCTGQGCAAILDYAHSRTGAAFFAPSRLFIYFGARKIEGTVDEDSGAQIRDVITVALQLGAPREATWPYKPSKFRTAPTAAAFAEALRYQALHAYKCQSLTDVRRALSMGLPVAFGVPVYPAIQDLSWNNYTLPMPGKYERSIGGHCMTVVGHDDARRVLIIRNSWGDKWGRAGHCLMPYDYWLKFTAQTDAWVIDNAE